jgi:hypothetical protein
MRTITLACAAGILAAAVNVGTAAAGPNDGSTGPLQPTPPRTELREPAREDLPETTGQATRRPPDAHRGWLPNPDSDRPLPLPPPDKARE